MYGAPGPGYQGRNETTTILNKTATTLTENKITEKTSNLNPVLGHPEYLCYFPTIFYRRACNECCQYKDEAKCPHNGWDWASRAAELRVEELKVKRKTMADRDREKTKGDKEEKEQEAEGSENDIDGC